MHYVDARGHKIEIRATKKNAHLLSLASQFGDDGIVAISLKGKVTMIGHDWPTVIQALTARFPDENVTIYRQADVTFKTIQFFGKDD